MKSSRTDSARILACYNQYMAFAVAHPPSRKQFLFNMEEKMQDNEFISDMFGIVRPGIGYEIEAAWEHVREDLVMHL